jgi:CubicO group peptidase (beta-lactamase class C family)
MKKLFFFFFLLSQFAVAQQTKFQKIDSLLAFLDSNNRFMGSIAIEENDKIVFAKTYGFADIASQKELNTNTKLKIGSITKTFTATMIMQLIEKKKLSLDTKLSKFYPQIPNAEKITIHHLLHHRTGILDYINGDTTVVNHMYRVNSREEMLNRIAGYNPIFEPGSKFEYSNSNYNILGYIIEDITKKSYADNLKSRIVKKLGLKNTSFPSKIDVSNNESFSHIFDGKTWVKIPEWNNSLAFAAGAISSTPSDLTAFMYGLFNGKLVSKVSLEQMKTMEDGYGKGLLIAPFYDRKFFGHTGGIENFRSVVGYNPEEELSIALIVNGDNYNRNDIMIGVLSLYYEMPYVFPDLNSFNVNGELLKKYAGTYSSSSFPLKITVRVEDGKLTAQATGQSSFPLTAKSESEFVFDTAGIKMIFSENAFILNQSGLKIEFKKE